MNQYESLCTSILENIGGKDNVSFATHCVTRLRLNVKDRSQVNQKGINSIPGVLGSQYSGGQFQIIIGQTVNQVFEQFSRMCDLETKTQTDAPLKQKKTFRHILQSVLDAVSGCVTPILPIIVAAGIFKMLAGVLGSGMLGILPDESSFVQICTIVGDAGFYFFPLFLAWSAAKKFETSIPVALLLCAVLIHPSILQMAAEGTAFDIYGIPMPAVNYSSQFLPSVLTVWIMSYVYRFFDRHCPVSLRTIGVPVCTILVMLPLMLCILAPAGYFAGQGIAIGFEWLSRYLGPVAVGIISALWYFMVATGMHQTVIAITVANMAVTGTDAVVFPGAYAGNIALMGLALAYLVRCAKKDKSIAAANLVTLALGGISEPVIFTTLLRYKQAMIAQLLGGFAGGTLCGLLQANVHFMGASNVLCVLSYGRDILKGSIACAAGFAVAFGVAFLLGFGTRGQKEELDEPVKGKKIALSAVSDPAFASGMMGTGHAIIPEEGLVKAPFDGEVAALFPTGHAIGLRDGSGNEYLIHIGIDTVKEQGQGFETLVNSDDRVKKGQDLIRFDLEGLKQKGYDMTVCILKTNAQDEPVKPAEEGALALE
ncbi:glucose PTS transporter subunit IIA [Faecalibaculum rodentium]|jgi:PTS system beta-glucosides-specific IIC component|uniref:glucose PTS transporter subunit IIA n=1 Tax=Faecalibaculum rodentium TaxID=1702221 RepID=UPI00255ABE2C|nr:glucose PTS transporter subunit IIA [Faecalibaculum rodentium]